MSALPIAIGDLYTYASMGIVATMAMKMTAISIWLAHVRGRVRRLANSDDLETRWSQRTLHQEVRARDISALLNDERVHSLVLFMSYMVASIGLSSLTVRIAQVGVGVHQAAVVAALSTACVLRVFSNVVMWARRGGPDAGGPHYALLCRAHILLEWAVSSCAIVMLVVGVYAAIDAKTIGHALTGGS